MFLVPGYELDGRMKQSADCLIPALLRQTRLQCAMMKQSRHLYICSSEDLRIRGIEKNVKQSEKTRYSRGTIVHSFTL